MLAPRPLLSLLALLALISLSFACAPAAQSVWDPDHPNSTEMYRRAVPAKARIPGEASTQYRYATRQTPMKLTASDGTGLLLRELRVEGVIDEPASLTQLHLTFENPHDRTLDGQFELLLPRGAEISRFAMMVGGRWIESEVVERQQAREVYADHKHMRRDPALLERERGRRFRGRIFPIAPRERKQIILSYTNLHTEADAIYRVPLAGLPRIDELDVKIVRRRPGPTTQTKAKTKANSDVQQVVLHQEHEVPERDVEVVLEGASSQALAAGSQAIVRVVPIPESAAQADERPTSLSVLVDTSASMAALARVSDTTLAALLDALTDAGLGELPIEILAFDQDVTPIYRGQVAKAHEPALATLEARSRLGASDLAAALEAVDPSSDRLLLLTDGDISAGLDSRYALAGVLERAAEQGLTRVDALALGAAINLEQLEWLVAPERLRAGVVVDTARSGPKAWVMQLLSAPSEPVSVAIAGAKQVWPERFTGLRPGEAVMVHAEFGRTAPAKAKLTLGGGATRTESVDLRHGDDPLVARSVAVLRTKALMEEIADASDATHRRESWRELVELSKEHRILNDYTSLLVLESDQAYEEFGIERSDAPTLAINTEAAANGRSGAVETLTSGDAVQLPVGVDTSRDFTAVVEITPTASRDAAGISLAGTSSAEASFGTVGASINSRHRSRGRQWTRSWKVKSKRARVGPRPGKLPAAVESFEDELDTVVQRCSQHFVSMYYLEDMVPYGISAELALRFDAQGRIVSVIDRNAHGYEHKPFEHCLRYLIDELGGEEQDLRPAHSEAAYELFWNYWVELPFARGGGLPPDDWRIPEVAVYSAELSYAGEDGTTGWARFIAEDLEAGLIDEALDVAWTWHRARPDSPLPYVSLGQVLLAAGRVDEAARAYASLIDLQPTRAEPRRFAAALLESLDTPQTLDLAIDSYRKARAIRPDQPLSYHTLALALARHGELQAAVNTLVDAVGRTYTSGRYGDSVELMREDLATLAAAAILADPSTRTDILTQLVDTMIVPTATARDCLRLTWESDASHLALTLADLDGMTYSAGATMMSNAVTNGYGTQGFEWEPTMTPGPLHALLDAYDLGPEGVAMGSVRRLSFDGEALSFETRPFVVWPGQERVALGRFDPVESETKAP